MSYVICDRKLSTKCTHLFIITQFTSCHLWQEIVHKVYTSVYNKPSFCAMFYWLNVKVFFCLLTMCTYVMLTHSAYKFYICSQFVQMWYLLSVYKCYFAHSVYTFCLMTVLTYTVLSTHIVCISYYVYSTVCAFSIMFAHSVYIFFIVYSQCVHILLFNHSVYIFYCLLTVCTQLLVTSRPDDECFQSYLQLLDKCLQHEVRDHTLCCTVVASSCALQ